MPDDEMSYKMNNGRMDENRQRLNGGGQQEFGKHVYVDFYLVFVLFRWRSIKRSWIGGHSEWPRICECTVDERAQEESDDTFNTRKKCAIR